MRTGGVLRTRHFIGSLVVSHLQRRGALRDLGVDRPLTQWAVVGAQ
jgi:hypothetical protein